MHYQTVVNSKGVRYKWIHRFTDTDTGETVQLSVTMNSKTKRAENEAWQILSAKFNARKDARPSLEKKKARVPFADVADEWASFARPTVKEGTHKAHCEYITRILKGIPDGLLFVDFQPADAERITRDLYYSMKLSYSYTNAVLITIKAIMRYAKKAGYIDRIDAFTDLTLKRRPATPQELQTKQNKFLNRDELQEVLKQIKEFNPRLSLAMEFISLTGLRAGELLALRVQDYDSEKHTISVNGTLLHALCNGDDIKRGTPKNLYSYRVVDLNTRADAIIRRFILINKQDAQWHPHTYRDQGYIFTAKTGNPYNLPYINKQLKKVSVSGKHISTHIFRHTHISLLAEMGVPLKAIMQRVGHNKPETTLAIYTHMTDTMHAEMLEKLEAL